MRWGNKMRAYNASTNTRVPTKLQILSIVDEMLNCIEQRSSFVCNVLYLRQSEANIIVKEALATDIINIFEIICYNYYL